LIHLSITALEPNDPGGRHEVSGLLVLADKR
jgi:hypothetical protein